MCQNDESVCVFRTKLGLHDSMLHVALATDFDPDNKRKTCGGSGDTTTWPIDMGTTQVKGTCLHVFRSFCGDIQNCARLVWLVLLDVSCFSWWIPLLVPLACTFLYRKTWPRLDTLHNHFIFRLLVYLLFPPKHRTDRTVNQTTRYSHFYMFHYFSSDVYVPWSKYGSVLW